MKIKERRPAVLAVTEHIEMELFSSEKPCIVPKQGEHSFYQRYPAHPLVPQCEEVPDPQDCPHPKQQPKSQTATSIRAKDQVRAHLPSFIEEIEIEMEVFPPFRVSESELLMIKSDHPSMMTTPGEKASQNRARRLKWKKLAPPKTGLVVQDVVCLPRGHYLAQQDRHIIPRGKDRAPLVTRGMIARITVDYGWSANQMESRLAVLFQWQFVKRAGQKFSFTYLQCLQGSRVLFVPDTPAEGWTGEQVLRISGHGPLYILSHHEYPQAESDWSACGRPVVNRKEFCLEASTESSADEEDRLRGQTQPRVHKNEDEFTFDLDTILRLFRQENMDHDGKTYIQVRRRDLLQTALKVVRRPGFCFRTTPIISFSGEETDGHEGPLREFFRLSLLELQQTSVFEGHPGRLLLTYDLVALEDRRYYEAGVLIGWSLAQGGPGPRCLHPALYQLMCGHNPSLEDFSWTDIADAKAQIKLQQLQNCTNVRRLSPSLCDWVANCGIPGIHSARSDDMPAIYTRLVKHYIYHRVASMIAQFTEGLNSCGGLWDTVQCHREAFMPLMTSVERRPLTLENFRELFTICFSSPDSGLRADEEATAGHWERVLAMVGDSRAGFSFEELLAFITGADRLPPLGFPRRIALRFYCQDVNMSRLRLPYVSTCALELFLPRGAAGAADLLVLLSRAVHEALGFAHIQSECDGEDGCIEKMMSNK